MFDLDHFARAIHVAALARSPLYPHALWWPIPEATTQPTIRSTTTIAHSMAGPRLTSIEALTAYVRRDDVHKEPTFAGPDFDGRMGQLVGIDTRADCNTYANPFATSLETQDAGAGTLAGTPWSEPQLWQIAGVHAFIVLRNTAPLQLARTWNGGGLGYHSQFDQWTTHKGPCPGAARIAQMPLVFQLCSMLVRWQPLEDDPMFLIVDTRPPGATWLSDGASKSWVDSGDSVPHIERRPGIKIVRTADDNVIASYGPVIGPHPGPDRWDAYGRDRLL